VFVGDDRLLERLERLVGKCGEMEMCIVLLGIDVGDWRCWSPIGDVEVGDVGDWRCSDRKVQIA
jgi:hypothetical protein